MKYKRGQIQIKVTTELKLINLAVLMPKKPRISLEDIRQVVNRGMILGSKRCVEEVEALTGKRLKKGSRAGHSDSKKRVSVVNSDLTLFVLDPVFSSFIPAACGVFFEF